MHVVIAEDDRALALFLRKSLELEGHAVVCADTGAAAVELVLGQIPDLLVLDLGLPVVDGIDILRALRGRTPGMSTMVLSGRSQLPVRIECLNLGADDFMVKPFSLHELLARTRALRRRGAEHSAGVLQHGDLVMDRIARMVTVCGIPVEFTAKEFTLLEYLLQQRGRAVSRQELLREVWRMAPDAGTNVVDVYVNYLRRKLGGVGAAQMVETLRGEGYAIGAGLALPKPSGRSLPLAGYAAVVA